MENTNKRDKEIIKLVKKRKRTMSLRTIGKQYGLTGQRICQIIKEYARSKRSNKSQL